jgi:uncharacterized protein YutE (UPF0331/DUF86 family)
MTSDVLLAKLGSIRRCIERIRTVTRGEPASVREIDVQEIVVLNLQRAVQSALDLAAHLIAERDWGLPDSLKQHFTILEQNGVLSAELGARLRSMTGFRNIAVHNYQALDGAILERIVADHLGDLEDFAASVARMESSKG